MSPEWRTAQSVYVEKRTNANGKDRYVFHCRLCRRLGRSWSSRSSMKRIYGKNDGPQHNGWEEVMDVWSIHMDVHHPNEPQPDWKIFGDIRPRIAAIETDYFSSRLEP